MSVLSFSENRVKVLVVRALSIHLNDEPFEDSKTLKPSSTLGYYTKR